MFWNKRIQKIRHEKKNGNELFQKNEDLSLESLKAMISNMDDGESIEHSISRNRKITIVYIKTLIDLERLNESIIQPVKNCSEEMIHTCLSSEKIVAVTTLDNAQKLMMQGHVLIYDDKGHLWAVPLENPLARSVEESQSETILYGPKDSFTEQIDQNITLLRRRLPLTELKTEKFSAGYLTKTKVVMLYVEGIANPDIVDIARKKISKINFDMIIEQSNLAAFMEDHIHSVFPQFQQTDRPDQCAYSLGLGKIVILVANTPFALIAPITFFHLFQSPEDYIHRWIVASFLRSLRYVSYMVSILLIPLYVALTTHHYHIIPLQILFVLLESRSKLPFSPFWEGLLMLFVLEIIKEASLRMPNKTSTTLGTIAGIVIGQAAVEAGFVSKILIVLVGVAAVASFLVPNYLLSKTNTLIQFAYLILASFLGIPGIVLGLIHMLAHLNGLTSLKQPYFSPIAPLYWRDWMDFFFRAPIPWMKKRPKQADALFKWRYNRGDG
ncbi:spore gernimation protein [Mesobacillus campisalis]|uniref:Spore gernimation protein n=1 Tax=Mesobacillus campisalis TaxID=1408103 RepID=A0A0M2SU62_9BACI|nr:spore germination protein [Mesobacillus campisalis]KKK37246.1 spore gernimation protein [Mesobacillus campisalis]